jgi:hypothetical protein
MMPGKVTAMTETVPVEVLAQSGFNRSRQLCPNCAQLQRIWDHSSTLQRTRPSGACCSTSNSYAHLHGPGNRTENPGVGGSIPSLPTIFFSKLSIMQFFSS